MGNWPSALLWDFVAVSCWIPWASSRIPLVSHLSSESRTLRPWEFQVVSRWTLYFQSNLMFDLSDPKSKLFSAALPWWCTTRFVVIARAFRALLKCFWAAEKRKKKKIKIYGTLCQRLIYNGPLYEIFNRISKIVSRQVTRKLKMLKYIELQTWALVCEYNQASPSRARKENMFAGKLSNCFWKLAALSRFWVSLQQSLLLRNFFVFTECFTIVQLIDMFLMNTFSHLNRERSNL